MRRNLERDRSDCRAGPACRVWQVCPVTSRSCIDHNTCQDPMEAARQVFNLLCMRFKSGCHVHHIALPICDGNHLIDTTASKVLKINNILVAIMSSNTTQHARLSVRLKVPPIVGSSTIEEEEKSNSADVLGATTVSPSGKICLLHQTGSANSIS